MKGYKRLVAAALCAVCLMPGSVAQASTVSAGGADLEVGIGDA